VSTICPVYSSSPTTLSLSPLLYRVTDSTRTGFCHRWFVRLEQSSGPSPQWELHRSCFQAPAIWYFAASASSALGGLLVMSNIIISTHLFWHWHWQVSRPIFTYANTSISQQTHRQTFRCWRNFIMGLKERNIYCLNLVLFTFVSIL